MYKSLALNSLIIVFSKVAPVLGLMLMNLYLAAEFGAKTYGEYAIVSGILFFLGPLLAFGTADVLLRKVSVYSFAEQIGFANRLYFRTITLCSIIAIVVWTGLSIGIMLLNSANPFLGILYCAPVIAFTMLASSLYRGIGNILAAQVFEASFKLLLVLQCLFLWFAQILTIGNIVFLFYSAGIVLSGVILIKAFSSKGWSFERPNSRAYKALIKNGAPYAMISLMQGLKNFADLFVVGFLLGTESAGVYSIALQIVLVISFGQMVVSTLLSRDISWGLRQSNLDQVALWFKRSTLLAVVSGLMYFSVVIYFGEYLVGRFLGEEYMNALRLAYILSVGRFIHLMVGPVMQILALSNNQGSASKIAVYVGILNTVLSLVLVKIFGLTGAAIAGSVSISVWALLLRYRVTRLFPALSVF